MTRRLPWLYPAWILICAVLFFALRGAEDPSRRTGRILSNDAGAIALQHLNRPGYEVVHVAYDKKKWIVLVDKVPHTSLHEAVVVELAAGDGRVVAVRLPPAELRIEN